MDKVKILEHTDEDVWSLPLLNVVSIAEALPAPPRRRDFDLHGRGEIYLRRSRRTFEVAEMQGLDIARVEVGEEFRRKGVFSAAVSVVEQAAKQMGLGYVFVENIYNPGLVLAIEKLGYTVQWTESGPANLGQMVFTSPEPAVHAYKLIDCV